MHNLAGGRSTGGMNSLQQPLRHPPALTPAMVLLPGELQGQDGNTIRFARAPSTLSFTGQPAFGVCSGWSNLPCNTRTRFSNDDIYFLEICLYSQICANGDDIFNLDAGVNFECDLDMRRFKALQRSLESAAQVDVHGHRTI